MIQICALSVGWLLAFFVGLQLGQPTVALAVYAVLAMLAAHKSVRALKAKFKLRAPDVLIGVGVGALSTTATHLMLPILEPLLGDELQRAMSLSAFSWTIYPALLIVVVGEEVLWRGLALQGSSKIRAVGFATLLYAAAQLAPLSWVVALAALLLGALWSVMAVWRENLWGSIIAHAIWTSVTLALLS